MKKSNLLFLMIFGFVTSYAHDGTLEGNLASIQQIRFEASRRKHEWSEIEKLLELSALKNTAPFQEVLILSKQKQEESEKTIFNAQFLEESLDKLLQLRKKREELLADNIQHKQQSN